MRCLTKGVLTSSWRYATGSIICPDCHGYGAVTPEKARAQARALPYRAKRAAKIKALRAARARGNEHVLEELRDLRSLRYPPVKRKGVL